MAVRRCRFEAEFTDRRQRVNREQPDLDQLAVCQHTRPLDGCSQFGSRQPIGNRRVGFDGAFKWLNRISHRRRNRRALVRQEKVGRWAWRQETVEDFASLKAKVRAIMTMALGVIEAPLAFGLAIGPVLRTEKFAPLGADGSLPDTLAFSLFLAAMLAVTAFPVMARILQEKGLTTSPMGAIGVAAAAVVTVGMFVLFAVAKNVNAEAGLGDHSKVFIGTAVYLAVMFGVVRPALAPIGRISSVPPRRLQLPPG